MNAHRSAVFAVAIALSAVACSGADPSVPSGSMQIYETCLETLCDQMQSHSSSNCSACESACLGASYDCDPSSACSSSCSSTSCSDYDKNTCVEQGYKVTLPNNPSADIAAACRRQLDHVASCGYTTSTTAHDCDRYAATELPDLASAYDCVAQIDCSSLADSAALAACGPAASTAGDDFCNALAGACSQGCTSTQQDILNQAAAWVRPDALAALQTCLSQPSCDESSSCLSAWIAAVE